jgi:hypothetical protein
MEPQMFLIALLWLRAPDARFPVVFFVYASRHSMAILAEDGEEGEKEGDTTMVAARTSPKKQKKRSQEAIARRREGAKNKRKIKRQEAAKTRKAGAAPAAPAKGKDRGEVKKVAVKAANRCHITDPSQQAIRFSPDLARKTLFEHLNFVFVAAQGRV